MLNKHFAYYYWEHLLKNQLKCKCIRVHLHMKSNSIDNLTGAQNGLYHGLKIT